MSPPSPSKPLRAEIVDDHIYLWSGGTLIALAIGNIKHGWRSRRVGGRLGTKRFGFAPEALAARTGIPPHVIRDAIIHEHAKKIA